ncbi:MAG: DUF4129 domain-containing protein [Thermomicrobiales bacterium]
MSSTTSPSTASPRPGPGGGARGTPFRAWQTAIAFPILLAMLVGSAAAPLIHLFLNPDFGLTADRPTPSMLGFAFVGLVGFWSTRFLEPRVRGRSTWAIVSVLLWAASVSIWLLVQPHYDFLAFLRDPATLVNEHGYLVVPLFLSFGAWWIGARYGFDVDRFMPEELRGLVQRCWLVLVASIILAAMVRGAAGQSAIDAARLAVPVCMMASVALIAGAEVDSTRRLSRRRGGDVPGWGRWYRLSGGFALAILVLSAIVLGILSPGAIRAILEMIQAGLRGVGWVLGYVLYAIVYVVYVVFRTVAMLLEWLFGFTFKPILPPEMPHQDDQQQPAPPDQQPGASPYADLLRWVAIGVAVVVVGIIILRLTRRQSAADDEGIVDEERESVFSSDLAKRQLRDLFRRRSAPPPPVRLDLDRPPGTAREAMVYLEVLANREGIGRREDETSVDFIARLRAEWAGTGGSLGDLLATYQPVRYGERSDEPGGGFRKQAASAWSGIWAIRRAVSMPPVDERAKGRRVG